MENIKTTVKDGTLTITIDLSHPGYVSETGKSQVIATTRGNGAVDGLPGFSLGVNFYKALPKAPKAAK